MPTPFRATKEWITQHLRRLERYTRTDNVYLAKNATLLIFTQGVSVLNGFILYILISHFLPKETYGQYKYYLSLFSLFALATVSGTEVAVSRAVANGNEGAVMAGFRWKLLGGGVGALLTLCGAGYYALNGRMDLAIALVLIAAFAPWIYAANVYGTYFAGKRLFTLYTKITASLTLLSFVGMAAAFIFIRNPTLLLLFFLITSSTNLIGYAIARSRITGRTNDPHLLNYAIHLSVLDVFGIVANSIDGILAYHFLGPAPLAVYALAIIPVEQIKGFLKSVPSIASPKLTVRSLTDLRQHMWRKILLYTAGTCAAILTYIVLARPFFALFFPKYLSSVPYSQVYSLSLIFGMPATFLLTTFTAKGLKKELTVFNTVSYSVQIALMVAGIWLYGLWGLIVSRILSRGVMLVTSAIMFHHAKETLPAPHA